MNNSSSSAEVVTDHGIDQHHDNGGGGGSITGGSSIGGGGSIGSVGPEVTGRSMSGCFFADATLDLDEAHDIAETPEPPRRLYVIPNANHPTNDIEIPQLRTTSNDNATNTPTSAATSTTNTTAAASTTTTTTATSSSKSIATSSSAEPQPSTGIMNRITSSTTSATNNNNNNNNNITSNSITSSSHFNINDTSLNIRPQRPPRWPRDLNWAIAFCIFVPISLFWPILHQHHDEEAAAGDDDSSSSSSISQAYTHYYSKNDPLTKKPLSNSSFYCLFFAYLASVVLGRVFYRTVGGGDGDEARHVISQILLSAAPLAVFLYVFLILSILYLIPNAMVIAIIPCWYVVRDVVLYRRWKRRYASNTMNYTNTHSLHAFFQALVCMSLDILSRSLRRAMFYRVISILLLVQLLVAMIWRWSILGALSVSHAHRNLLLLLALLGGKWATGTVARLLSLIASGGIASWFNQQTSMMEEMEEVQQAVARANNNNNDDKNNGNGTTNQLSNDNNNNHDTSIAINYDKKQQRQLKLSTIPEAYRTADASVYQPVLDMEHDDIDDDELEEMYGSNEDDEYDDFDMEAPTWRRTMSGGSWSKHSNHGQQHGHQRESTVKSFLLSGLTVSFGSVARCGLTGGFAQFLWCQLRKVDEARTVIRQRFPLTPTSSSGNNRIRAGLQAMPIAAAAGNSVTRITTNETLSNIMSRINLLARNFVRSHSDLAMSHVAAYYKSYNRAARDVAQLVDESGVEPIINDDITTHMCACVGGSISALIVIIAAYIVVHYRNHFLSQKEREEVITDAAIAENMLVIFVLCYTIIFTVMEPLRASIKAVYVCFAQHPRSLRQSFPLIFHRLSRISGESNDVS